MIIKFIWLNVAWGKQIKINDDVHASLDDLASDSRLINPIPLTIIPPLPYRPNYLFTGPGDCVETTDIDFKFTICPMDNVTQTSINSMGKETHLLGVWTGITVDYDDDTIEKIHYTFGDMDGCTKHREMIVNLACGDNYQILGQIDESEQCTYQATVQHPAVCDHDRLLLYPLLSDEQAKHRFQQLKQAQRDHLLTADGLEYYYKQLLVQDQLLLEQSEIERSDTYQQWKSDNEAKSEYERELERLRAEVASLKSDLATCQSQSAFSDDFDPVL